MDQYPSTRGETDLMNVIYLYGMFEHKCTQSPGIT